MSQSNNHLIAEAWATYRREVLSSGVSEGQLVTARQAFYTGASHMFAILLNLLERDIKQARAIQHEIACYQAQETRAVGE